MSGTAYKQCRACGVGKPLEEFHRNCNTRDGRIARCKPCARIDMKLSRQRNRAWHRANNKRRYAADAEGVKAAAAAWRAAHPDRVRAVRQAHRANNLAAVRAAESEKSYRRRAAKVGARSEHVPIAWLRVLLAAGCEYCGGPGEHIEHMVPLSRGGGHAFNNITGSCAACNLSKNAKIFPDEWPAMLRSD